MTDNYGVKAAKVYEERISHDGNVTFPGVAIIVYAVWCERAVFLQLIH
jgi:hypothetical protein